MTYRTLKRSELITAAIAVLIALWIGSLICDWQTIYPFQPFTYFIKQWWAGLWM